MFRLIKKYKNRRLYDTEISQYVTLDSLKIYVIDGIDFKVIESATERDITNEILLQILVEMEAGTNPFLSKDGLRQIIKLANHPLNRSFKLMMEQMLSSMSESMKNNPLQQATDTWNKQVESMVKQWQDYFNK